MILPTVVGTGFYTYVEAARVLGRSLSYVNKKIASGELRRERHGSQWMVTADSVERLLARERVSAGPDLASSGGGTATLRLKASRLGYRPVLQKGKEKRGSYGKLASARGEASFAQVGRLWKMIQCFATCFGSATVLSWRTALSQ
jgi:excisionase family DNA binding protein